MVKLLILQTKKDLGLNVYEFDAKYKQRLLETLENGHFFKEWLIEYNISNGISGQPRFICTSYQPTKDSKYIIELDASSETADELITMLADRMARIKRDNDEIIFVNLHITDHLSFSKILQSMYYMIVWLARLLA